MTLRLKLIQEIENHPQPESLGSYRNAYLKFITMLSYEDFRSIAKSAGYKNVPTHKTMLKYA